MDKRIQEEIWEYLKNDSLSKSNSEGSILARLTALESKWKFIFGDGETMEGDLKAINDKIAKLEEAVERSERCIQKAVEELAKLQPKPTCKTCRGSGYKDGVVNWGNTCPDCAKSEYESLKTQIDNLQPKIDRIKKNLDKCAPKTSCAHEWAKVCDHSVDPSEIYEHCRHCFIRKPADPQPERTLAEKFEEISANHNGSWPELADKYAKASEEHYRPLIDKARCGSYHNYTQGFEHGKKIATEELRKKYQELVVGKSIRLDLEGLSKFIQDIQKLFNG